MPSQWSQALSDVPGVTGPCILRARVAGERAPRRLAALRPSRGTKDAEAIALALPGTWRADHLFVLTHALALFEGSTAQLSACDAPSAPPWAVITPRFEPAPPVPAPAEAPPSPRRQPHSPSQNAPAVPTRAPILRLTGVALVAVHGLSDALAQTMRAEVGTPRDKGPADQHVCSWLGLAPTHDLSGGTVLKSRPMQPRHRAAHAFRMAAQSGIRAEGALGAFSRRLQGRRGPTQARVATAHKMARTVSHMLQDRVPSHASGAAESHQRFHARELKDFQKKATKLGSTLSLASPITP